MAKRARGSTSRPGQRAPLQRDPGSPSRPGRSPADAASAPKPATLTAEEESRAAELEAQILAEEAAADSTARRNRERARRSLEAEPVARPGSIALRASQEYAYVGRDVRRIVTIGGSLVGILIVLWVVVEATGIGPF